jgi:hypothetical protein
MLLFRSEEHMHRWNERRGIPAGATLSPHQGWQLARAWYGDRLSPEWTRRTPEETNALFERLGLTDPFWRLEVSRAAPVDTDGP